MCASEFDFRWQYSEMVDEELLSLARDPESLTNRALLALREEMNRRGLESKTSAEPGVPEADTHPEVSSDEAHSDHLPHVGRALVFLALYLIAGAICGLWALGRGNAILAHYMTFYARLKPLLIVGTVVGVLVYMLSIFAGLALLRKWDGCVRLARASLFGYIGYGIYSFVPIFIGDLEPELRSRILARFGILLVLQTLWCGAWLLYLHRSARGRRTYQQR